jgi:hypothetical protein
MEVPEQVGWHRLRRAVLEHLGTSQVTRVIYGSIIGLALVVALQAHPPEPGTVVGLIIGTAVAVALAEVYAEVVGSQTRNRRRLLPRERSHLATEALAVGFGVGFPAVFFALAWAGAIEADTAFNLAKWTGLGLIAFYGFCAGRLAGEGVGRALLQAFSAALIGAALIAVKALLH